MGALIVVGKKKKKGKKNVQPRDAKGRFASAGRVPKDSPARGDKAQASQLSDVDISILHEVRRESGHAPISGALVSLRLGLPVKTVRARARVLVNKGLLCALDGEPWALRVKALQYLVE